MNSWMIIIILAVLQGVAEFLPVSSSGHLALLSSLCGLPAKEGAAVSIVLHAGSLVAISIFYFNTLLGFFRKNQLHLLLMVILCPASPTYCLSSIQLQNNPLPTAGQPAL